MKSVQQRLSALREAMKKHGVDAFVIPSADPHLSEYLPEHWQARRDFSGFTGSAGTLVVTADKAGVWTDSRYWEQGLVPRCESYFRAHFLFPLLLER